MHLNPILNPGTYVFCQIQNLEKINQDQIIGTFKEKEGWTVILSKASARALRIPFEYEAAWITLQTPTDLDMIGLTAEFSSALADEGISCNVIAAYNHDHIFVDASDAQNAIEALKEVSI